jgi:hypothetical protein
MIQIPSVLLNSLVLEGGESGDFVSRKRERDRRTKGQKNEVY